jgi:hypothetical protein
MAAGLGFKTFTTGEVLTAADTNGYLMQGVLVFASAAARDAAITSPQEGQFAYLKDTNVTTYYTGSAWTNLDTTGMTNPMTTTGDMVYSSSGSTPARLGIGTTGQVVTVAGGIPSWATPTSGLTKISVTNFSNVATQDIDSVFSSTYDAYYISLLVYAGSQADDLHLQMRYSTNTMITSYVGVIDVINFLGTSTITGANGAAQMLLSNACGASGFPTTATFNVVMPGGGGSSCRPQLYGQGFNALSAEFNDFGYENSNAQTYTGFRLKSSSSNISGTVVVYGLVK